MKTSVPAARSFTNGWCEVELKVGTRRYGMALFMALLLTPRSLPSSGFQAFERNEGAEGDPEKRCEGWEAARKTDGSHSQWVCLGDVRRQLGGPCAGSLEKRPLGGPLSATLDH